MCLLQWDDDTLVLVISSNDDIESCIDAIVLAGSPQQFRKHFRDHQKVLGASLVFIPQSPHAAAARRLGEFSFRSFAFMCPPARCALGFTHVVCFFFSRWPTTAN